MRTCKLYQHKQRQVTPAHAYNVAREAVPTSALHIDKCDPRRKWLPFSQLDSEVHK